MVRLLDASITLSNWAVALNMFALWAASAGIAGLILVLFSHQPRQRLIAGAQLAPALAPSGSAEITVAPALVTSSWTRVRTGPQ